MSLGRKEIRAAIVDALKNETDAEERIFPNRILPIWVSELPAIMVQTKSEDVSIHAVAPVEYERKLQVDLEIISEKSPDTDVDDDLDVLAAQVEAVMFHDNTLGELCHDVVLKGAQFTVNRDGEKEKASLVLSYEVIYHSVAANDPSDLEWLNRADISYEVATITGDDPKDIVTGLGE